MHAQHVALAAAQDGVRVARAYGGTERRRPRPRDREPRPTSARPSCATRPSRSPAPRDEVTVTVTAARATSILGMFALPVHEQARGPVERFIPSTGAAR